ncbi:MAG: trypsin-like peptidase domain-containing protein [Gammaproteobacteria bacterium]
MPTQLRFAVRWTLVGLLLAILYLISSDFFPTFFDRGLRGSKVSHSQAVKKALPSVVSIRTATAVRHESNPLLADPLFQEFFDVPATPPPTQFETGLGSGVIVGKKVILTNHHVVNGVDRIEVVLSDGRRTAALIVGVDPETDLAVIRTDLELPESITFADPMSVEIGDIALAIGNPVGIGITVTQGIVSATGRNRVGINTFENFIQTDAAINPGNSGGALVNTYGELIGVNAAILGYQGIGFAIPSGLARTVLQQLLTNGEVTRGWLGIEARDLTAALGERFGTSLKRGIVVLAVMPQGPAALAGLQNGDVIFKIDGHLIADSRDAVNRIAQLEPTLETVLSVQRGSEILELTAMVQRRPKIRR